MVRPQVASVCQEKGRVGLIDFRPQPVQPEQDAGHTGLNPRRAESD